MWKGLTAYLLPFVLLQVWAGSPHLEWLAFPLNGALVVAATALLYVCEREWGRRRWVATLRSARMACCLLILTLAACLWGGVRGAEVFASWPFVALMVALMAHLTLLLIHRLTHASWRRDGAFLLVHGGLWLALVSGTAGAADASEWRALVGRDTADTKVYDTRGWMERLPYQLQLEEFRVETHASTGKPTQYAATLLLDGRPIELAVNDPYTVRPGEELYLMSYQSDEETGEVLYCVLQIVREPWKYPLLAGIVLLLAGVGVMLLKLK